MYGRTTLGRLGVIVSTVLVTAGFAAFPTYILADAGGNGNGNGNGRGNGDGNGNNNGNGNDNNNGNGQRKRQRQRGRTGGDLPRPTG